MKNIKVYGQVKSHLNQAIIHMGAMRDAYIGLFDDPGLAMISDPFSAELTKYIEQLADYQFRVTERIKSEKAPFITPGKRRSMTE